MTALLLAGLARAATVEVAVDGLVPDGAPVIVALFTGSSGFPTIERAAAVQRTVASATRVSVRFEGVADGTVAVAVHHDQDGDGTLDFRWLPPGPAEGTSASCAERPLAIPRWSACSRAVSGDAALVLSMWY